MEEKKTPISSFSLSSSPSPPPPSTTKLSSSPPSPPPPLSPNPNPSPNPTLTHPPSPSLSTTLTPSPPTKPPPNSSTSASAATPSASTPSRSGEYFTRIGVGSPPKYLYMVLDTGSDVVWLLFVGAAGLIGLGRGKLSFPSQTGSRFNSKFSYCLVDRSASSKPSFVVSRTARFTPLVPNPKLDTFYYMELLGISVGGTRVPGATASLFKLDPSGNGAPIEYFVS
ncbi:hypothetical protein ACLB2K_065481 [Fragaria x ananassa]